MTLNRHIALNSVLRRYVWSSQAWLSKFGLKLVVHVVGEKNSCSIARCPCDSTAFLLLLLYQLNHLVGQLLKQLYIT